MGIPELGHRKWGMPRKWINPTSRDQLMITRGGYYAGNDVILRDFYLKRSAKKTWIQIDRPLHMGYLRNYALYVHDLSPLGVNASTILLQIWRPENITLQIFTLVWQRPAIVEFEKGEFFEAFDYSMDAFFVHEGDRMGWTCTLDECPISVDEHFTRKVYARKVRNNQYPEIGGSYSFADVAGFVFSVAVEITDLPNTRRMIVKPRNTVAMFDTRASLYCSTQGGATIQWYEYVTHPGGRLLANGGELLTDAALYDVIVKSQGSHSELVIKFASAEVAGKYACMTGNKRAWAFAELIVVWQPSCHNNVDGVRAPLDFRIRLSCHVTLRGAWMPEMKWKNIRKRRLQVHSDIIDSQLSGMKTITTYVDYIMKRLRGNYICTIMFDQPNYTMSLHHASNIPDYRFTYSFPLLKLYGVFHLEAQHDSSHKWQKRDNIHPAGPQWIDKDHRQLVALSSHDEEHEERFRHSPPPNNETVLSPMSKSSSTFGDDLPSPAWLLVVGIAVVLAGVIACILCVVNDNKQLTRLEQSLYVMARR